MSRSLYENHWGSPTLKLLNVLGVLGVLNVLNVLNLLNVLNMLNMPHGNDLSYQNSAQDEVQSSKIDEITRLFL